MYTEYTENAAVVERDQRISLMERFVGLDQARLQAEQDRDSSSKRLDQIREEMASLRHELRQIVNADADDVPQNGMAR